VVYQAGDGAGLSAAGALYFANAYTQGQNASVTLRLGSQVSSSAWFVWRPVGFDEVQIGFIHISFVIIPHWVFIILFAIAPLVRLRAWRRRRRRTTAGSCA
jgi:hypothetical protein